MSLNPLSSFFKRFQQITLPDETVRRMISELVGEMVGVTLPIQQIRVQKHCIYIDAKPTIKSEIFLRKKVLLDTLKERTGVTMSDIR